MASKVFKETVLIRFLLLFCVFFLLRAGDPLAELCEEHPIYQKMYDCLDAEDRIFLRLSLIHISEPTRPY